MKMANFKIKILLFTISVICLSGFLCLGICHFALAEDNSLEFSLDASSDTVALPKAFKPNIDLSGRGYHKENTWPQTLAAKEVLERWQQDMGFGNIYRMQYSLWDISQLSDDKEAQDKLLGNYEWVMKNVTDAGGIIILDIFGTPAGLGQGLDKKIPPRDLKVFKALVKGYIKELSCNKRYNIWYEIWNAPDLDDFFLGRKQEFLNLYRVVSESVEELEAETKIHIPIGGPSVSWWFQNMDGNTVATPERSLIYELMQFCSRYRLRLDFISWHAFSTDPAAEKESSVYKKTAVELIRDWLSYFNFDRSMPLIVDEWNYDRDSNVLAARGEKSFICASYIPSRIKNMQEAGIDYQIYFSLEDFKNNKEGVIRNVGAFTFDPKSAKYDGSPKAIYNVFRMLSSLGSEMYVAKLEDEFAGVIATKTADGLAIIIYHYIDPDIGMNYISKNIASLRPDERKIILNMIRSQKIDKIIEGSLDVNSLRVKGGVKNLLQKMRDINDKAKLFQIKGRNLTFKITNMIKEENKPLENKESAAAGTVKEEYAYQRYVLDSSCNINCEFKPVEEKDINMLEPYQEKLELNPYSVQMIVLKKKPAQTEPVATDAAVTAQSDTSAVATVSPKPVVTEESKTTEKVEDNAGNKQ